MKQTGTRRTPSPSYESYFEHTALFEFSKVINSSTDLRFILNHILLTIMGKLLAAKAMVMLESEAGLYSIELTKGLPDHFEGTEVRIKTIPRSLFALGTLKSSRYPWINTVRKSGIDILLPMVIADKTVGFLGFGARLRKRKLQSREITYLRSLANISATAIQKNRMLDEVQVVNRRLDRKIQELNTLFELGKEFNTILDPEKLVRLLVFSLLGQIGVSRYLIALAKGADMSVVASRVDGGLPQGQLLRSLAKVKKATRVPELAARSGANTVEPLLSLGLHVLVPMQIQNESKGILLLGEKLNREPYTQEDLDLLSSLGNLAIISLENARLFKEAIEKQKLEDELQIAREIQKGLLPSVLPTIPSLDIAATNLSSKQVGGDYYDVIEAGKGRYVLAIGDVSGKGTPASLLMANLQATIRALVPLDIPLDELTARVNDLMCQNTGADKFITFFWGFIDVKDMSFTYVNAGHNYPYVIRSDRSVEYLDKGGMILGVMPTTTPYEQGRVSLRSGDLLLFYTDGVSEAMNKDGQDYGEGRLEAVLFANLDRSAEEIMNHIHEDIMRFARDTQQSDDITMMVVKVR